MSMIGIDVETYEDLIDLYKKYDIRLFQIAAKRVNPKDMKKRLKEENIELNKTIKIVVHFSYSINLAHVWTESDWWIQQLLEEIRYADEIDAFAIVIHTGKNVNYTNNAAINNMYSSLIFVHQQTEHLKIQLLIETPAGQGSELLVNVKDFIKFMLKFTRGPLGSGSGSAQGAQGGQGGDEKIKERFGICIDTCHVYAAGQNIAEMDGIEKFFKEYADGIGLDKIKLVHLNNATYDLGSRIDRHANLHNGAISNESMDDIARFINKLGIPMILETPTAEDYKLLLDDYSILKSLVK